MRYIFLLGLMANMLLAQRSYQVQCAQPQAAGELRIAATWPKVVVQGLPQLIRVQPLVADATSPLAGWFTLTFAASADSATTLALLRADSRYTWAEPNYRRSLHTSDPDVGNQYYHPLIKTTEAWPSATGQGIVVGVVDTGLEYSHPEFTGQIWLNPMEDFNGNGRLDINDLNGRDEDGNGVVDDVIGYDFVDQTQLLGGGDYLRQDPDPLDDNQHGTLVSGILNAKADNGIGGYGVAPGCRVMVLRAFSAEGVGEDDDIARAIVYAADNGARVLNFSFGDIYPSRLMHAAIQYAYSKNVVMIASAGNGTGDNLHYPSNYPEVISISASAYSPDTRTEYLWPLSSFGTAVDLCAPGSGIYAPTLSDPETAELKFDFFSGTSCSAPMVSAAVAMLLQRQPDLLPRHIRGILCATADDISNPGWDHYTGAGRLNIARALSLPFGSHVEIHTPYNDSGTAADSVWVVATVQHPSFVSWQLSYQPGLAGGPSWIPLTSGSTRHWADTLHKWDLANLPDGEYTLRLAATLSTGQTLEDRVRLTLDRTPPLLEVKLATPAWDGETRKLYWAWRCSDPAAVRLYYRQLPAGQWQYTAHDRFTRYGELLLGPEHLTASDYAWYLHATNSAGDTVRSPLDTLAYAPSYLNTQGFDVLNHIVPGGAPLSGAYDLDQDGSKELILSRYDASLTYGRLLYYEWQINGFALRDSIGERVRFIPKDLADYNGDGRQDLLGNLSDSIFIYSQNTPTDYPKTQTFFQKQGLFPAVYADSDGDGRMEFIAKDEKDYYVWEWNGSNWAQTAKLEDNSGDYFLSTAPKALVHDFDGDGQKEIIFGDSDGDFVIYEATGDNTYALRYTNHTDLTNSANYLAMGDWDGDGRTEFFVAAHTSTLRDEVDYEYLPKYWHLRIFEASANNTYTLEWEDWVYNVASPTYNCSYSANMDNEPQPELLFSVFPRTLLLDHDDSSYYWRWMQFGALTTHHTAADWNDNGVPEFSIAFGDTTRFFEQNTTYIPSRSGLALQGEVTGGSSVSFSWNAIPGTTRYRMYRGNISRGELPASFTLSFFVSGAKTDTIQLSLLANTGYAYVLQALDATDRVLAESNILELRTHALPRLLSATALDEHTIEAHFSQPMMARMEDLPLYSLNGVACATLISGGATTVVLQWDSALVVGDNDLTLAPALMDAWRARIDPAFDSVRFQYNPDNSEHLWLSTHSRLSEKEAILTFNRPVDPATLLVTNFELTPTGTVTELRPEGSNSVYVKVDRVVLGTGGYPVTLRMRNLTGTQGETMRSHDGDAVTFLEHAQQLTDVYVYPNPVRPNDFVQGCRFANLTPQCTLTVFTATGHPVRQLTETDNDGGLDWDLKDPSGKRLLPGVYLYRVENADGQEYEGKFVVLEE